ncbi:MAG: tRNA (adenosine(37)-N6)-threonylcarbamoyltransferase complex transferase subunit TsaD [Candidatus Micrarchaeota archaeon]|nr:tRNA (adenosine(37)-N6)-threonylcarbamoyltransferase complex transferase subunit TsaD [Candidatus Micrarchaeota archaeon]
MSNKYCLGIESTAHTFGIGICDQDFNLLANEFSKYNPEKPSEGIIPWKSALFMASEAHTVLQRALDKASLSLEDIDVFAFSQGPGIGNCLKISCSIARKFAFYYNKPIVPVNHAHAHIEAGRITLAVEQPLVLYLSGANSQIILPYYEKTGKERFHVLGETVDMGIGNLFDSLARALSIYPSHGSMVEKLSETGKYHYMPYTVIGMNMAFSGLYTHAIKMYKDKKLDVKDICKSVMHTAFAMTVEATERALALTQKKELLLCGGVALNRKLREMLRLMCDDHEARLYVPDDSLNADQGGMIALAGMKLYKKKQYKDIKYCIPQPYQRIDELSI